MIVFLILSTCLVVQPPLAVAEKKTDDDQDPTSIWFTSGKSRRSKGGDVFGRMADQPLASMGGDGQQRLDLMLLHTGGFSEEQAKRIIKQRQQPGSRFSKPKWKTLPNGRKRAKMISSGNKPLTMSKKGAVRRGPKRIVKRIKNPTKNIKGKKIRRRYPGKKRTLRRKKPGKADTYLKLPTRTKKHMDEEESHHLRDGLAKELSTELQTTTTCSPVYIYVTSTPQPTEKTPTEQSNITTSVKDHDWDTEFKKRMESNYYKECSLIPITVQVASLRDVNGNQLARYATIFGSQISYFHFSGSQKLVREKQKQLTTESDYHIPANLTGAIKFPIGDYYFFRCREFCKRPLDKPAQEDEFEGEPKKESESQCIWWDNFMLFGCPHNVSAPPTEDLQEQFLQFCEDPVVTGAIWLKQKIYVWSDKWLFVFDGQFNGKSPFGELIEAGVVSAKRFPAIDLEQNITLFKVNGKLQALDINTGIVKKFDSDANYSNDDESIDETKEEEEESVKKWCKKAVIGRTYMSNLLVKYMGTTFRTFYAGLNDDGSMCWNFDNQENSLESEAGQLEIKENPPLNLTAKIDGFDNKFRIYFVNRKHCKTRYSMQARDYCSVLEDNDKLFGCDKAHEKYSGENKTAMLELCRDPDITGGFMAINKIYLFRYSKFWMFQADYDNKTIGTLISGLHDAASFWEGWRLDHDGFWFNGNLFQFIMFKKNQWWSWYDDREANVVGAKIECQGRKKSLKQPKVVKKKKNKNDQSLATGNMFADSMLKSAKDPEKKEQSINWDSEHAKRLFAMKVSDEPKECDQLRVTVQVGQRALKKVYGSTKEKHHPRFGTEFGNQMSFFHFSNHGRMVSEQITISVDQRPDKFPSDLTAAMKMGNDFYYFFRCRKFCRRRLDRSSIADEFEDPDKEVDPDSKCVWWSNNYLFKCDENSEKSILMEQFCEDPKVTSAVVYNHAIHLWSDQWLFIYDGPGKNKMTPFGDLVEGGVDSTLKWPGTEWGPDSTVWVYNDTFYFFNFLTGTYSIFDDEGGKALEEHRPINEKLEMAQEVHHFKSTTIVKTDSSGLFARIKDDVIREFAMTTDRFGRVCWSVSRSRSSVHTSKNVPLGLTAVVEGFYNDYKIYFVLNQKHCRTRMNFSESFSADGQSKCANLTQNGLLFECNKIGQKYKKPKLDGMEMLCSEPDINGGFIAKGKIYVFRYSRYWIFSAKFGNTTIGLLESGPHDALTTWPGWRLDHDGFFYYENRFIMLKNHSWWSWNDQFEADIVNEPLQCEQLDKGQLGIETRIETANKKIGVTKSQDDFSPTPEPMLKGARQMKPVFKPFKMKRRAKKSDKKLTRNKLLTRNRPKSTGKKKLVNLKSPRLPKTKKPSNPPKTGFQPMMLKSEGPGDEFETKWFD